MKKTILSAYAVLIIAAALPWLFLDETEAGAEELPVPAAVLEPAYLPEAVYRDHPDWRGPACQHSRRAKHEYFAPCLDNAEYRKVYVEAIAELCRAAPFESFNFLVNDSGSGLCWCPHSYPGMNGPAAC